MILFILKLLGMILLIVLGLVLLILFLVFFAPIKYKSSGYKQEGGIHVQAFITYLNPLVRIYVTYPEETIVQIKLLWFSVYTVKSTKNEQQEENNAESAGKKAKRVKEKKSDGRKKDNASPSEASEGIEHTISEGTSISETTKRLSSEHANASDTSISDKKQSEASSATETSDNTDNTDNTDKKKNPIETVKFYITLFQENRGLLIDVLKTVINALKTILPRKCFVHAVLGTGQADTTGYVYAIYCALLEYMPAETEIVLEPVWIEKVFFGEYSVKGKIRLIHFLIAIVKVIADPNVRRLYKKIRSV